MEYEDVISAYKNGSLDISDLKKKLELARPLNSRPERLDLDIIASVFNTLRDGTNAQLIAEKPEKVEEYKTLVDWSLTEYYSNILERINSARAWGAMKVVPPKITTAEFKELLTEEKLRMVTTLNKRFKEYLKVQKYADLREKIIGDGDLEEASVQKMQFVLSMFNCLKSDVAKEDFFCMPEELVSALINFRKSKHKRLEDYFETKNKYVRQQYENYANYYSTEEFRDLIENLLELSKTLKISVGKAQEYYSCISKINFEIRGLEDEYETFEKLKEKNKKMFSLIPKAKPKLKEEPIKEVKEEPEKVEKKEEPQEEIKEEKKQEQKPEVIKKQDIEDNGSTGNAEKEIEKQNNVVTAKEQITPLILAWFGRDEKPFSEFAGPKQISEFLEKIKELEKETGTRIGLYIVTNADKKTTLGRMQELQHKAKAKGLSRLVEGALGGYSSFRIEPDGTITDLAVMEKNTREEIVKLLESSPYDAQFKSDLIDPREKDYIRYFFSIKKNSAVNIKYLKARIALLLNDPLVKKQPISFVPFMEGDYAGVDVLLQSQLDGLDKLSEFLKSKYYIAPGKTLKANIYALGKFTGEQEEVKESP